MFTIPVNFFASSTPTWRPFTLSGDVPSARFFMNAAYVPGRGTYVYSGTTNTGTAVDADMYLVADTGVCTKLTTTGTPGGRWGYGMYFDSTDGLIHILSGYDSTGGHTFYDTTPTPQAAHVTFDPATNAYGSLTQTGVPEPGTWATAAYGSTQNRGVWWAGQLISTTNALVLWSFDGTTWANLNPGPTQRQRTMIVFDQHRGVFTLFGGINGSGMTTVVFDDTAETDGDPTNPTTWVSKGNMPVPSSGGYAAWSPTMGTLLFGGGNASALLGGTYLYDGAVWRTMTPAASPSARAFGACVWSSGLNRFLIFGGQNAGGVTNEAWTYGP